MHFSQLLQIPGLPKPLGSSSRYLNKLLFALGFRVNLTERPDGFIHMHTIEQRSNLFLSAELIAQLGIPGEWAEFGCYTGQSAMVLQKVLQSYHPQRRIYLYDSFQAQFGYKGVVKQGLMRNFKEQGLNDPILVEGYFKDTIPAQLPDKLAFVHIDCGTGGQVENLVERITCILTGIYNRLTAGAIVHLMDYHDPALTYRGSDPNPGVRVACAEFLQDKPEKVVTLYGNQYSHGFFIKN